MCTLKIILFCLFVLLEGTHFVKTERKGCILPPHPSFGWWSYVHPSLKKISGLQIPDKTTLEINCNETYKLDGCKIVICNNGTWAPKIGKCLKTCPSIYSTQSLKVTCNYKGYETVNCTEPVEDTLAEFKCASFYEDTRLSKAKALCLDGKWSEKIPECAPVCGRTTIRRRPTLIINADKTKKGQFPWQIAIYKVEDKLLICGGSLLSERVVLTAAHCLSDNYGNKLSKDDYIVAAGKYYRKFDHRKDQHYGQISEIHDVFFSDKYEGDDQDFEGDIAIIITKKFFKFSPRVQPVCIDWSKKLESVVFGEEKQKGYVSGWGHTRENSNPANELKSLSVPAISRKECQKLLPDIYRRYMTHDKFCAGYKGNGTSVCTGDSGGGLVFKKEKRFFIAGIVSLAPVANTEEGGCDSQQYTLYTLVYNYTDNFILKKLTEFKLPDNEDTDCKNCTVISTEATTAGTTTENVGPLPTHPPTPRPAINGTCILPQHPKNGRLSFVGNPVEYSPGNFAPTFTVIGVTCNAGYNYIGVKHLLCLNSNWSTNISECKLTCPPLDNLSNIKVECFYNDAPVMDCKEPVDGTIAKFQCDPFYQFSNVDRRGSVCINGKWSALPICVPVCGQLPPKRQNLVMEITSQIIPWHVTIFEKELKKKKFICGGSLISTTVVVTAAHCITDFGSKLKSKENYIVAAGLSNFSRDANSQISKPKEMFVTGVYKGDVFNYAGDIGLIVVDKPFVLSVMVQPVCIDWAVKLPAPTNKRAIISIWNDTPSSTELEKYTLEVASVEECSKQLDAEYERFLTADKICAVVNDTSICKAHSSSGVGLVVEEAATSKYFLRGVLSLMLGTSEDGTCDTQQVMAFTKVEPYIEKFILNVEARYRERIDFFELYKS